MWEFFITVEKGQEEHLYGLEQKLKSKFSNVITAVYEFTLSLACEQKFKFKIAEFLSKFQKQKEKDDKRIIEVNK